MTGRYAREARCANCGDTGTLLWKQATPAGRKIDIAYRCHCPAGDRWTALPQTPANPPRRGDDPT